MPLHRKRKVQQRTTVFDQPHHLDNSFNVRTKNSNKLIANGGILKQRSDDNLGEEDEIDCLVDDDDVRADDDDLGNETTLLRDSYDNILSNGLNEHQYFNGNEKKKESYCETASYKKHYPCFDRRDTLIPENCSIDNKDNTLQNNYDPSNVENKTSNNGEPPQVPRVQRILEKGKANLSRSKSELGEQHRKVLSQLTKGKSGITEQNKRFLANITSGMDKGKRFVLPGFSFGNSNNVKTKESPSKEKCQLLNDEEAHRKFPKAKDNLVQRDEMDDNHRNVRRKASDVSSRELSSNNAQQSHNGDSINHDLDLMLTNLGIQISAAEAATTDSASYSQSTQASHSLMTQSVFVTSSNLCSSSVECSSSNMLSNKLSIAPTNCDRRLLTRSNLSPSCSSDRVLLSRTPNDTDQNQLLNISTTPVRIDNINSGLVIYEKGETYKKNGNKCNWGRDVGDKPISSIISNQDPKSSKLLDINDYLQLERSLENDYGEFDFIDGDSTLTRAPVVSYSSNYNYTDINPVKNQEKPKNPIGHNNTPLSLFDEVIDEINKEKNEFLNSKENKGSQANVILREENKLKNDQHKYDLSNKKSRRLSSTSLSSASTSETSCGVENSKYLKHMGSNASFQIPLSPTRKTSAFIPSSVTNTPNVSVYADHTLMLRSHHKRRRWLLMKHTNPSKNVYDGSSDGMKNNQTQMIETLPTENPNLRRCASLAQNVYSESSSDCSPFLIANCQNNKKNIVNGIREFDNTDQVSKKLFLLNDNSSSSHTVFSTNAIDNDNNNSAKNEINRFSWLSTSITTPAKRLSTPVQYCNAEERQKNKEFVNGNNNNNIEKSIVQHRSRRSPWLLRSNLSSYARRRRGSSTSLHAVGLNNDETLCKVSQSSSIHPVLISKNGATTSNITQNSTLHHRNKNSASKETKSNFIHQEPRSSFNDSDLTSETGHDDLSLNRR
jgi:hypothetical protein